MYYRLQSKYVLRGWKGTAWVLVIRPYNETQILSREMFQALVLCDGVTVIMVSHDVAAAERYATHILQLGHSQLYFGTVAGYHGSEAELKLRGGGCK